MPASPGIGTALTTRFATALAALGPFGPAPNLAIALSGGGDSMALALLADGWARAHGGRITALTIDHGLRAESRPEAEQVAGWMQHHGIAHTILTPAHTAPSTNLQEAARHWRYDALAEWCRAHGVLHCLIAHHAADQRETIRHHTERGDTADGASGMAMLRRYRGVRFLRPLLGEEKPALLGYLTQRHQPWVEDPSNTNRDFARVRIRQALAADAAATAALAATAQAEGRARAARDTAFATAAQCVTLSPLGYADIAQAPWRALDPAMATRLLADTLAAISGATRRPRAADTLRLYEALAGDAARRTLHGCELVLRHGRLRIAREPARVAPALTLHGKGTTRWDGRFTIHHHLPAGVSLTLAALGRNTHGLPPATPALWHLDAAPYLPHMEGNPPLPEGACVTLGFAPAKPLAAAPFWWFNMETK